MILAILAVMVVLYALVHWFLYGEGLFGIPHGGFKAVTHWLLGLSAITVIFFVFKAISLIALVISVDILTPPYGIDIETLFALPLAGYLQNITELSLGWAIGIAYAIVFALALGYLLFWWFVLRKRV